MTQEDKELLLKDLCARLPYKPIVHAKWSYRETNGELKHKEADRKLQINDIYAIWDIKPYLRPMSSMTEDEKKIICSMNMLSDIELSDRLNYQKMYVQNYTIETFDLFNEHHFDYRGLIEKGLALEAPRDMYK